MKTLKRMIRQSLYIRTGISVMILLIFLLGMNLVMGTVRAYDDAHKNVQHIKSVLEKNKKELEYVKEEYRISCIHNAETVARIIEIAPEVIHDIDELKEIATSVEISEIHIFDNKGRIFAGTHPEYYDYTFDSGSQMNFFKSMLEDKKLRLVQEITPNTAEGKLMQYSAVWGENGKHIIQVGMTPVNVAKATEKNELSHVFHHFRINPEVDYYAIDKISGEVRGATHIECTGKNVQCIGGNLKKISEADKGFFAKINNKWSYCVFELVDQNYIGQVVTAKRLFRKIPSALFWTGLSFLVIAFILVQAVAKYLEVHVVEELEKVNDTLQAITDGDLRKRLQIKSSVEFNQLSRFINLMVNSLLENNMKMSYALSKTNMFIGTYEYGSRTKLVRYTEYIPNIFSLSGDKVFTLMSDKVKFTNFLEEIKCQPDKTERGVYIHEGKYIRIEEIVNGDNIFGVAVDVTVEMMNKKEIEKERDIDILTGLYNRRALDKKLEGLFLEPQKLKEAAMVMIDADGLKGINDTYGHEKGDIYLRKIGSVLQGFPEKKSIVSRQGGDEYVLFLYGYESQEELEDAINRLTYIQNNSTVHLDDEIEVPLRFSLGCCRIQEQMDYKMALKQADKKMYENKLMRKGECQVK